MPSRQPSYPVKFVPKGLVDALDATEKFMGACLALTNLVFDQSNPEIVVSRPGVGDPLTEFSSFSSPGVISVQITVGGTVYGMIASSLNPGKDEIFAYDHDDESFVSISGITDANSPTTQPTSGPWTPPTMAVIGTYVVVTHPGFSGGAIKFGLLDISTPSAPSWSAGDLATNALPTTPTAVANYRNRAWFACGRLTPFSDVLDPATRTNSTQELVIGDTSSVYGFSGLPVQTTSSGIVAALLVFKEFQVWQITGDAASSDLALNYLSLSVGTVAQRTIVSTPRGVYFACVAGPYIVDPLGGVKPVTASGQIDETPDIVAPFQNCTDFTRACAAYSSSIYRVCLDTIIRGVAGRNDYWFDEIRKRWNGPHSFPYDCASQHGNHFVLCSNDSPAALYHSHTRPDASSVYDDDGTTTSGTVTSSSFPKTGHMSMHQIIESTLELASAGADTTYTVTAVDDQQNQIGVAQIPINGNGAQWGFFVWGDGTLWTSGENRPQVYSVDWADTLVFKKLTLSISAEANAALAIGAFFGRYQDAGYTLNIVTGTVDILATEDEVLLRR